MKNITLNTEAQMPIIGLGTFLAAPGETYQAVRWAIKLGYKHIDCAAAYGNQTEVGQALHDAFAEGDIKREEIFVTSKLWNDSHAVEDVRPACEQTLKELKHNPKAITKIARERYFMKADDEDIFVLSDDDKTETGTKENETAE